MGRLEKSTARDVNTTAEKPVSEEPAKPSDTAAENQYKP